LVKIPAFLNLLPEDSLKMRKLLLALSAVSLSLCFAIQPLIVLQAQTPNALVDSDEFFQRASRNGPQRDHSRKIEDLLKRMTLEEKVGQMTQLSIDQVTSGKDQAIKIDPAKVEQAIVKYNVGSILNVADQALTVDDWHQIIGQLQEAATKKTRLGIPMMYGIDSIHGANYVQGATLFPQEIGMAATFNPELMKRAAEIPAI